jgi:hypothetical protein
LKDSVDYKRQIRLLEEEKTQLKTKLYYMNLEIQKKDKQMEEIIKASKVLERDGEEEGVRERNDRGRESERQNSKGVPPCKFFNLIYIL